MLKASSDLISTLQKDPYAPNYPDEEINQLSRVGQSVRRLLPPHELEELTNKPEIAESLHKALGREVAVILFKPDAFSRDLLPECTQFLSDNNFKITNCQLFISDDARLELHYQEHREKAFYHRLMSFMKSGPIMAYRGRVKSIQEMRAHLIDFRYKHRCTDPANLIHCSDSHESGLRETRIWFW